MNDFKSPSQRKVLRLAFTTSTAAHTKTPYKTANETNLNVAASSSEYTRFRKLQAVNRVYKTE